MFTTLTGIPHIGHLLEVDFILTVGVCDRIVCGCTMRVALGDSVLATDALVTCGRTRCGTDLPQHAIYLALYLSISLAGLWAAVGITRGQCAKEVLLVAILATLIARILARRLVGDPQLQAIIIPH